MPTEIQSEREKKGISLSVAAPEAAGLPNPNLWEPVLKAVPLTDRCFSAAACRLPVVMAVADHCPADHLAKCAQGEANPKCPQRARNYSQQ